MIDETLQLPAAPRGAAIMSVIVGSVMCLGGAALAYTAYISATPLPLYDWRYVVGACAIGMGLLRFRRGCSLGDE
jgi:hypothetical protein